MMTHQEQLAKQQIEEVLNEQGYPTYSKLLDLFDLHLTEDPKVIGFMIPSQATITINKNLDIEQVSTIVRHEILHEYLNHDKRMEKHVGGEKVWQARTPLDQKIANIAGDYEISNRGYTDADKQITRHIRLKDQILRGLVTEDDHADWVNLSIEDMYDRLEDENKKEKEMFQKLLDYLSPIQIGDQGDKTTQDMEGIKRKATAAAERAADQGKSGNKPEPGSSQQQKDMQKIADAANQLQKEIQDAKGDSKPQGHGPASANVRSHNDANEKGPADGDIFDSKEEQEEKKDLVRRVKEIEKAFSDAQERDSIYQDTQNVRSKEVMAKAATDLEKYKNKPIVRFTDSLNKFIHDGIVDQRDRSWSRFNKTYIGTGLIKPGISHHIETHVPLINVYFDRSGSWDDAKTRDGEQAIATLHKYVQAKQIQVKLYYFSTNVFQDRKRAEAGGGTSGQPILEHIQATHPTNVIVMTDSDISDCTTFVEVPGAVWFLFKDGVSENLREHLKGKELTKSFEI